MKATRERHTKTAAAYGVVAVRDAADNTSACRAAGCSSASTLDDRQRSRLASHEPADRAGRPRGAAGLEPRFGDGLADLMPSGWQALATFRIGFPTETPNRSPRRPAEAVITR